MPQTDLSSPPPEFASIERMRARLHERLPELSARFGVESLALFGSRVRGDHRPESDLIVCRTVVEDIPRLLPELQSILDRLEPPPQPS